MLPHDRLTNPASPPIPNVPRRRRVLFAAVIALAVVLAPTLPAVAASDTVALVGDLQSELGCPGDWQPECAATELKPVDGQPDLYRSSFQVPAGTWQYKVALDDSWTVNYGANGQPGEGAHVFLGRAETVAHGTGPV